MDCSRRRHFLFLTLALNLSPPSEHFISFIHTIFACSSSTKGRILSDKTPKAFCQCFGTCISSIT